MFHSLFYVFSLGIHRSWYHLLCYPCDADNVETFLKENVADNTTGGMLSIKRDFQNITNAMKKASALRKTENCPKHRKKGRNAHRTDCEKVLVKRGRVSQVLADKKKRLGRAEDHEKNNGVEDTSSEKESTIEDRKIHKCNSPESPKTNCRMWRNRTFNKTKSSKGMSQSSSPEASNSAYPSPLHRIGAPNSSFNLPLSIESVPDDELIPLGQEEVEVDEKDISCSVDTIIMDDDDDDDSIFEDTSDQKGCDEAEGMAQEDDNEQEGDEEVENEVGQEEEDEELQSQPLIQVREPTTPPPKIIDGKNSSPMEEDDYKTSEHDDNKMNKSQVLSQRKLDVDESLSHSSVPSKRQLNNSNVTPVTQKNQKQDRTPTCINENEKEATPLSSPSTKVLVSNTIRSKRRLDVASFASSSSSDSTRNQKKRKTYARRKKWGRRRKDEGSSSSSMKPMLEIKVTKYT